MSNQFPTIGSNIRLFNIRDIVSTALLSIVPVLGLQFQDIYLQFWFLLIAGLSLVLSSFYKKNIARFAIIVILSILFSNVLLTIAFGAAFGYIFVFYYLNTRFLVIGCFFGTLVMLVCDFISKKFIKNEKNRTGFFALLCVIFLITSTLVITNFKVKENIKNDELFKRDNFFEKLINTIDKDELTEYTTAELISTGLVQGIYSTQEHKIIHGYGGEVQIRKEGDKVTVTYDGIPAEQTCRDFVFINNPDMYGFKETKIDGKIADPWNNNASIDAFFKEACYSGKKDVTVEYTGTIDQIKESAF